MPDSEKLNTTVRIDRWLHDYAGLLSGGNASAGIRLSLAAQIAGDVARLPTASEAALGYVIAAGSRMAAWPDGLLVGDPDTGCCISFARDEICARDGRGNQVSRSWELPDLGAAAQLAEGAIHAALDAIRRGGELTRPIGGECEVGGHRLMVTAAGPVGASVSYAGATVPLPGQLVQHLAAELRSLSARCCDFETLTRQRLERALQGVNE